MELNKFIFTGDEKIVNLKYDTISILYQNNREDLIDTFLSLNDSKTDKNDIEELESIIAKNGRPDILKYINSINN